MIVYTVLEAREKVRETLDGLSNGEGLRVVIKVYHMLWKAYPTPLAVLALEL